MSGFRLEPATREDLPEVTALERECYADPWAASAFAELPDNPRVHFAVAREIGHGLTPVVGYVVAWYVMDEGELANLAVAPRARCRGLAGRLLRGVLEDASRRGIQSIFLEVRESNTAAIRLYLGNGFESVGRRKGYYRSPVEDALIFRRRVDPGLT